MLTEHGFVCSMSRKGNCWDNAVAERFFLNLKMERIWQRNYATHAEARLQVVNYIAGFYNYERLHSLWCYLSPSIYERTMAEKELIVVSKKYLTTTIYALNFDDALNYEALKKLRPTALDLSTALTRMRVRIQK